jgi:mRNA interferase MazF
MHIQRGDIWLADLGSRTTKCGSEQRGVRPVVIIQNNVGNQFGPTVIVAPITHPGKQYLPTHVRLPRECGVEHLSIVLAEQIRTLDKMMLLKPIGAVHELLMIDIDEAIRISLGLQEGVGEVENQHTNAV